MKWVLLAGLALFVGCTAPAPEEAGESPADQEIATEGEAGVASASGTWAVSIEPRPEDVSSIDGIVAAFYDIVSGPAGERRNWARDSTLYLPGVRFVTVNAQRDGGFRASIIDHGGFAAGSNAGFERQGFYEQEIHRVTQHVGNVAYVLSSYEWRTEPDGPAGGRGVNSISLFWDGDRWWITQAMWSDETAEHPIPPELLPGT